ncbi:MAG: type III-B CRISPR module-associated Cmr3 family protein [Gammaproteobacteria bacterium]
MSTQLWCFEALDSWFFRESRPHGAVGASELASLFPPPARTVAGAVRTLIGEATGVDWRHFASEPDWAELRELIGVGDKLGQLYAARTVSYERRLTFVPCTAAFVRTDNELQAQENKSTYVRLRPGAPVSCDLGTVRLPEMSTPIPGKTSGTGLADGSRFAHCAYGWRTQEPTA